MAKAVYIQPGDSIDYINATGAAISAGDIVMVGGHLGVAGADIPPGGTGALHVTGVYALPTAATFTPGADVYWTGTAAAATGTTKVGWAVASRPGAVHVRIGG